jgi:hypothetical protein
MNMTMMMMMMRGEHKNIKILQNRTKNRRESFTTFVVA